MWILRGCRFSIELYNLLLFHNYDTSIYVGFKLVVCVVLVCGTLYPSLSIHSYEGILVLHCHLEENLDALNEKFIEQKIMMKSKLTKIT